MDAGRRARRIADRLAPSVAGKVWASQDIPIPANREPQRQGAAAMVAQSSGRMRPVEGGWKLLERNRYLSLRSLNRRLCETQHRDGAFVA